MHLALCVGEEEEEYEKGKIYIRVWRTREPTRDVFLGNPGFYVHACVCVCSVCQFVHARGEQKRHLLSLMFIPIIHDRYGFDARGVV